MKENISKKQFWGLIVYSNIGDGCYNAIWNNTWRNDGLIYNEIIRKKKDKNKRTDLSGVYYSTWIEDDGISVNNTLTITSLSHSEFSFEWVSDDTGEILFRSIGMQIGESKIAVTYWFGTEDALVLSWPR